VRLLIYKAMIPPARTEHATDTREPWPASDGSWSTTSWRRHGFTPGAATTDLTRRGLGGHRSWCGERLGREDQVHH
jgi:hypothetical protein